MRVGSADAAARMLLSPPQRDRRGPSRRHPVVDDLDVGGLLGLVRREDGIGGRLDSRTDRDSPDRIIEPALRAG